MDVSFAIGGFIFLFLHCLILFALAGRLCYSCLETITAIVSCLVGQTAICVVQFFLKGFSFLGFNSILELECVTCNVLYGLINYYCNSLLILRWLFETAAGLVHLLFYTGSIIGIGTGLP